MRRLRYFTLLIAAGSMLANCGSPSATSPEPSATMACSAEIGVGPADRLAQRCRLLSPATHPPCNAANSCAMIRDEINRGCALLSESERKGRCDD